MKLIQYRFSEEEMKNAPLIGDLVQNLFVESDDIDVSIIYVDEHDKSSLLKNSINIRQLSKIVSDAFKQSYALKVDYSKSISIKSNRSCRFVVFEDDGLLRICYSTDDAEIIFKDIDMAIENVSELLINTDLFDFL